MTSMGSASEMYDSMQRVQHLTPVVKSKLILLNLNITSLQFSTPQQREP